MLLHRHWLQPATVSGTSLYNLRRSLGFDRRPFLTRGYWAVDDLFATGTSRSQSHALFKTAAGVAADCAGDQSRAEDLHQQAVAEADHAYPVFQPDARIWYADMLIRRNGAADRSRAGQLLADAHAIAERLAMPAMARRSADVFTKLAVRT